MPTDSAIALTTHVGQLPGVGRRRVATLENLGLRCVADLLRHLPIRYEHEAAEQPIAEAERALGLAPGAAATLTVQGEIQAARLVRGRRSRFEATLSDGSGSVLLTWFNASWMQGRLHPGACVQVTGRAKRYGDRLQFVNPRWEPLTPDADDTTPRDARLRPVYPASEEITSRALDQLIDRVLDEAVTLLDDHLPDDYRRERGLLPLDVAYRAVHRPADRDEARAARRRLAFDELLLLQLGVMLKRRHRQQTLMAPALERDDAIDARIRTRFPFALTESQRTVIDEIAADLVTERPMNRLLQGDVGAGKTVVALYAMLMAVASGHQATLMAPTELLAEQHFASLSNMLAGSSVRLGLLTGSLRPAERTALIARVAEGEVDLIVGTHALLTEHVAFRSLAVAVVDEQHRFGVHQRATLRAKGHDDTTTPHTLVMTATPIPRTMSLTIFGDLDISTIGELPPGRRPVITRHLPEARSGEAYTLVAERLAAGEQAYVVVPVIDESSAGLKDVTTHLEMLQNGPLAGHRLAALHGRLKREERDAIMTRFRAGEIDTLVATTVIEVGVDVPRATVMVIEHAERFGLAQLHQLRGRVGRGGRQSVCVLVADPTTEEGHQRIAAIVESNDGFVIAERDLAIRGPGELFGARQSGMAPFHAATLPEDAELLALARRDAVAWVERNPTLGGEADALLRRRLLKAHGKRLGLGDVA
ncbi:MAG: ATP-dependent DNA helicase RecG [Phycisphaerales bacterium]|nr:ATP-dependent DNA helicase RecG [Phycisphaerae bacterium]NNF42081.1 ATP-dependent DNA helicase RecG [Phycisphaerales bacterium]NNM24711.1 ATP-dependent DNA helicase RecG [Phycisphaerales bacterium]